MGQPSNPYTGQTENDKNSFQSYFDQLRQSIGKWSMDPGAGTSPFSSPWNLYKNFGATGGVDPSVFDPSNAAFKSFLGPDAGINPGDKNAAMGWGTFENAAKSPTGLVTPGMISDTLESTQSANAAAMDAEGQRLTQGEEATGGEAGAGIYSAGRQKLAMDSAKSMRDATLAARLGLNKQELSSREWGAGEGASSMDKLLSLITGRQKIGAEGLAGNEGLLARLTQSGKEFGATGMTDIEKFLNSLNLSALKDESGNALSFDELLGNMNPTQPTFGQQLAGGLGSILPFLKGFMPKQTGLDSSMVPDPSTISGGAGLPDLYSSLMDPSNIDELAMLGGV